MPKHTDRVRIEEVDWQAVFPWLRLLGSFKMAMSPGKLLTSLLLIVLLYVAGQTLDLVLASKARFTDITQYRHVQSGDLPAEKFSEQLKAQHEADLLSLRQLLANTSGLEVDIDAILSSKDPHSQVSAALHDHYTKAYALKELEREQAKSQEEWQTQLRAIRIERERSLRLVEGQRPIGAFDASLKFTIDSMNRFVRAVVGFNSGLTQMTAAAPVHDAMETGRVSLPQPAPMDLDPALYYYDQTTALAALRDLLVVLPCWLWHHHTAMLVAFVLVALILTAVFGGAVARMAALHATRDDRASLRESLRYVLPRWWSFLLTPLVPLLLIGSVAMLMGLGGMVFFNLSGTGIDIVAAMLFVVAILCGLIIMATILLSAAGIHLVYPATAVNGSDLFDAIARAFNYVLNRPWRWLFYNAIALVQGCVMYLVLTLMLGIAIWAVQQFVGMWVFTSTDLGSGRFETILPASEAARFSYAVDYAALDWSGKIAAFLIRIWMFLTIALLPAFVISYYFCANTWTYILLRRDADGIEFEDVMIDPPFDPNAPRAKDPIDDEPAKSDPDDAD